MKKIPSLRKSGKGLFKKSKRESSISESEQKTPNPAAQAELIDTFTSMTKATPGHAKHFLLQANWDADLAVALWFKKIDETDSRVSNNLKFQI
jgi:hypothetical protein